MTQKFLVWDEQDQTGPGYPVLCREPDQAAEIYVENCCGDEISDGDSFFDCIVQNEAGDKKWRVEVNVDFSPSISSGWAEEIEIEQIKGIAKPE